jgi:hypothetical protein
MVNFVVSLNYLKNSQLLANRRKVIICCRILRAFGVELRQANSKIT